MTTQTAGMTQGGAPDTTEHCYIVFVRVNNGALMDLPEEVTTIARDPRLWGVPDIAGAILFAVAKVSAVEYNGEIAPEVERAVGATS